MFLTLKECVAEDINLVRANQNVGDRNCVDTKNTLPRIQIQFKFKNGLLKHTYMYNNDTSSFCAILNKVTLH